MSVFTNLATENFISAHQFGKLFNSTFFMTYNQSIQEVKNKHVAYQLKAYQISNSVVIFVFDFVVVTIFEIKNKL